VKRPEGGFPEGGSFSKWGLAWRGVFVPPYPKVLNK